MKVSNLKDHLFILIHKSNKLNLNIWIQLKIEQMNLNLDTRDYIFFGAVIIQMKLQSAG